MGKILKSDIDEWVNQYRLSEQTVSSIRKNGASSERSTALDALEQLQKEWVTKPNLHFARALKHCLEMGRNRPFIGAFKEMHAFVYLFDNHALTYEMAKKQTRKVLEAVRTDPEHAFFKTVRKEHRFLFRQPS